ncbi:hypothetical protein BJY04DRAFT_222514 [Aspergillus karnatakaensis]|uniref:uncharacterized protein n=1 Tax=Aspergillus karnatakaensis TaxID=1810916 RepID=UPI003CCD4D88
MAIAIIDPAGDIIANCAGSKFQVSSNALSLASPVFRAMLTPGFKKSLPVDKDLSRLPVIEVDHALPSTFALFSDVVHHILEPSPVSLKPGFLHDLALFVEHYRCQEAMKDRGVMWLKNACNGEDLWNMLMFTYAMRLPWYFKEASSLLVTVIGKARRFRPSSLARDTVLIPAHAIDLLDNKLETLREKTESAIMDLLKNIAAHSCSNYEAQLCAWFEYLSMRDLLPGSVGYQSFSFQDIHTAAKTLPDGKQSEIDDCDCPDLLGIVQRERLLAKLSSLWNIDDLGLCLSCVKDQRCEDHDEETDEDD